ncbi:hypothetical protein A2G24_00965 [Listeria monocytogenes]|uniref:Uncharacterized protein n=1 Tax=Listeria monocytogenes TaxID=1639 RepID=A0A823DG42_LISMN|nr:hypothetical protein [Listeria monocytogenes]EAD1012196.1 hypothetical protein [Listeria monocytogenes]EAD1186103.1 hypothetical protein [Listeria monocytogenes]EAF8898022.1 hypothetical protein [Listeria monocytogenes]
MTQIRQLNADGIPYYPLTHYQAVSGLQDFLDTYLNSQVYDSISLSSKDGTVFILTVSNDGKLIITEDESD